MLQSLGRYPAKTQENQKDGLEVKKDDMVCCLGFDKSERLALVSDENGKIGYLPKSHVQLCEQVNKQLVLQFIDYSIVKIHETAMETGKYSAISKECLRQISSHRSVVSSDFVSFMEKVKRVMNNSKTSQTSDDGSPETYSNDLHQCTHPGNPSAPSIEFSGQREAYDFLELLRRVTDLPYNACLSSAHAILDFIIERDLQPPQLSEVKDSLLKSLELDAVRESSDIGQLDQLFQKFKLFKDDSQQRSWHLHDDEESIRTNITAIYDLVTKGNPQQVRVYLETNTDTVDGLVLYFQMETRSSLRIELLHLFIALCYLSNTLISNLLCTVLPSELINKFIASTTTDEDQLESSSYFEELKPTVKLLFLVFSGEGPLPNTLLDTFDVKKFISQTLLSIEMVRDDELRETLVDMLLIFNCHFMERDKNPLMQQLSEYIDTTELIGRFLVLFNRADDSNEGLLGLRLFTSILKFATDLFANSTTANVIYTNDLKVVIDICIRQILDLPASHKERETYLMLLHLIISNTEYADHYHRRDDIMDLVNSEELTGTAASNIKLLLSC